VQNPEVDVEEIAVKCEDDPLDLASRGCINTQRPCTEDLKFLTYLDCRSYSLLFPGNIMYGFQLSGLLATGRNFNFWISYLWTRIGLGTGRKLHAKSPVDGIYGDIFEETRAPLPNTLNARTTRGCANSRTRCT
jgi:hypothetical protein